MFTFTRVYPIVFTGHSVCLPHVVALLYSDCHRRLSQRPGPIWLRGKDRYKARYHRRCFLVSLSVSRFVIWMKTRAVFDNDLITSPALWQKMRVAQLQYTIDVLTNFQYNSNNVWGASNTKLLAFFTQTDTRTHRRTDRKAVSSIPRKHSFCRGIIIMKWMNKGMNELIDWLTTNLEQTFEIIIGVALINTWKIFSCLFRRNINSKILYLNSK